MEETVGSHKPFPNRPNQPNGNIRKCFMVFANLLTLEAPKDVRKHPEFIVLNDDKSFSLFQELIIPDERGKIDHFRVMDKEAFCTINMLCQSKYINPQTLISIN